MGTLLTYFGHISRVWTCFLPPPTSEENIAKLWAPFWTCLTGLDIFWAHFGHFLRFGYILDALWTLKGVMCPKCVHTPIVLQHRNMMCSPKASGIATILWLGSYKKALYILLTRIEISYCYKRNISTVNFKEVCLDSNCALHTPKH